MLETDFTPLASAFGGALIGLSAVLLLATTGRIAGISGILGGLATARPDLAALPVRLAFVLGLLVAMPAYIAVTGTTPDLNTVGGLPAMLIAGLAVGFGSGLGGGCTSGHGVCGIGRLSMRSIIATLTFMATAAATVFILHHLI